MALPFEQQPQESSKAFAAFSVYLSLGAQRSIAAVAQKLAKSDNLIKRWSAKFDWTSRVQAHAAHMAVVEREASEAVTRARSAEWGKRQQELREEEWEIHAECIRAGKEALKRFYERGKGATLGDIARMLELASKLGRLASGLATDKTEITGDGGGPVLVEFEAAVRKIYGVEAPPAIVVEVEAVPENSKSQITDKKGEEAGGDGLPGQRAIGAATPQKENAEH
jgi:hypothetical protein